MHFYEIDLKKRKELADWNEILRVWSRAHLEANPEKIRTEFAQEMKDLVLAGFLAQPTASNPEHIVMKTYEIYQKNSQKLSKWSPSSGFSVVQKYAIKYLLALTEPFFVD